MRIALDIIIGVFVGAFWRRLVFATETMIRVLRHHRRHVAEHSPIAL